VQEGREFFFFFSDSQTAVNDAAPPLEFYRALSVSRR